MSDVRQLTPAACILVTLPYRSATVWSATKVVLYCRKSKCFPLYLCIYRTFANFAPMQYVVYVWGLAPIPPAAQF